ncbi:hypothetical protein EPO04_01080 [Patescibacteria group bacterium]|nr:MAG: hypothetical protein EPO04_01080 [Patescibacteria group bacterium]
MSQKVFTYKGITIDIDSPRDSSIFRLIPVEKVDSEWRSLHWGYQWYRSRLAIALRLWGMNDEAKETFEKLIEIENNVKDGYVPPYDRAAEERKEHEEYIKAVFGSVQS